jgi:hypothetical protein
MLLSVLLQNCGEGARAHLAANSVNIRASAALHLSLDDVRSAVKQLFSTLRLCASVDPAAPGRCAGAGPAASDACMGCAQPSTCSSPWPAVSCSSTRCTQRTTFFSTRCVRQPGTATDLTDTHARAQSVDHPSGPLLESYILDNYLLVGVSGRGFARWQQLWRHASRTLQTRWSCGCGSACCSWRDSSSTG